MLKIAGEYSWNALGDYLRPNPEIAFKSLDVGQIAQLPTGMMAVVFDEMDQGIIDVRSFIELRGPCFYVEFPGSSRKAIGKIRKLSRRIATDHVPLWLGLWAMLMAFASVSMIALAMQVLAPISEQMEWVILGVGFVLAIAVSHWAMGKGRMFCRMLRLRKIRKLVAGIKLLDYVGPGR